MRRIVRSRKDRVIAGVCGGFAEYFNLEPALIRLVWIFFTLFGGSGILAYVLAMIIIPEEGAVPYRPVKDEKKETHSRILWGALLIIVGIILFVQHSHLFQMIWDAFWGSGVNVVFAVVIIAVGVYLIYTRRNELTSLLSRENVLPLHLSEEDKRIAGVCGGIAETLHVDSTVIRFIWVFGTFMSYGVGILLYLILAAFLPKSADDTEIPVE